MVFVLMVIGIHAQTLDFGIWFDLSAADCDSILQAQGFRLDTVEGMQHRYLPADDAAELDIILYIEYDTDLCSEWLIHYKPTDDPDKLFETVMEKLNDFYGEYIHYDNFMESYTWEVEEDIYYAVMAWEYEKQSLYLRYYWE